MDKIEIIPPVFAMVGLTFLVWIRMYVVRLGGMARHGVKAEEMKDKEKLPQSIATSGDNFNNIMQLPTLFYVAAIFLYLADQVTVLQVGLAWTFVALRVVHSIIHSTYNRIIHRFLAYVSGAICLWIMWGCFIWGYFSAN